MHFVVLGSVCMSWGIVNRLNQFFDDLDDLAPATDSNVQDLWNRYTSVVKVNVSRGRDLQRPLRATRSDVHVASGVATSVRCSPGWKCQWSRHSGRYPAHVAGLVGGGSGGGLYCRDPRAPRMAHRELG